MFKSLTRERDYRCKPASVGRNLFLMVSILTLFAACAGGSTSIPNTEVLDNIYTTLEDAERSLVDAPPPAPPQDIMREIMPGLTISEDLLAPVEERFNIIANRENAGDFFNNLVMGTDYGVAVSPQVQGEISLSLPNVTIDEVMVAVQETYGYQISRRGNVYQVQPPGLQTRIFSIDYLNVRRTGSSDVQVTSGSTTNQGGNNNNNNFGGGNFGGGGFGGGNFGGNNNFGGGFDPNNPNANNRNQQGGQGGGGQVSTQTETDFWTDIQETLEQLIGVSSTRDDSANTAASAGGLLSGLTTARASQSSNQKNVVVQPQVGLIMVTAYPDELDRVADYIEAAQDILSREVTIQVQFLEVILNKGFQSAIDFDTFGPGGADASTNTITGEFSASGNISLEGISNPLAIATNFTDFNAVFRILETRGTTQVLSSPSLKVMNNQKAVFQDGDEEFFQTGVGSSTVNTGAGTTTQSANNIQPFFSGISMDITPQISADGTITLHVHPTITTVVEQTKPIGGQQVPLARTSKRELDSIIRGQDGRIVVLGGLAYERSTDDVAGIPGLNDIPVVGVAFDQRRNTTVKSEFIILLRPIIATPQTERRFIRESNERFRNINQAIDPFFQ